MVQKKFLSQAMKRFFIIAIAFFTVYVFIGIVIYFNQRKFIYAPSAQDFSNCPAFATAQKVDWHGTKMYVQKNSDQWVVFYHGNAGSACDRSYFLPFLKAGNYSYIFPEYAGYSDDPAQPTQSKLMSNVADVNDFLNSQHPAEVIVVGESLGTALATYHSSLNQPNKLLLISPFDNMTDEAATVYPEYPVQWMLHDIYPSNIWAKTARNVLIIHGTADAVVPIGLSEKLFQAISGSDKTFIAVSGAGHNNILNYPAAQEAIATFLK